MPDLSHLPDEELLRLSIAEASSKGEHSDFALGQLYAGMVAGNPDRERVWLEETAPDQAELDVHLEGGSVEGHSTNARDFSAFVTSLSTTVKEIAKTDMGLGRMAEDLLITAPSPGSVRFVLTAPDPAEYRDPDAPTIERTEASTVVSDALREVAAMLYLATDGNDDSPLYSMIDGLSPAARAALKKAAKVTGRAGWIISGTVRQRNMGVDEVHFDPAAAERLVLELDARKVDERSETLTGQLDGFRRSLGTVYLLPTGRSPVPLAVTNPELLTRVAEIAADPDVVVQATIHVVESTAGRDSTAIRTSRTLTGISLMEPQGRQGTIDD